MTSTLLGISSTIDKFNVFINDSADYNIAMINIAQQTWLRSLGISLYVPNTWIAPSDESSTQNKKVQDSSFEAIRSIIKTPEPTTTVKPQQSSKIEEKPQIVVVNMLCYVTEHLCFIEHEHPKAGPSQRQLMNNILLALGEQSTATTLPLKINRSDFSKAQQQIGAFLQAGNILDTSAGQLSKKLVVMGNTLYRLLISNEGFDQAIGMNSTLTSAMSAWNIDTSTPLNALVIPNTLSMLKDVQNKKITWSVLKEFSNTESLSD